MCMRSYNKNKRVLSVCGEHIHKLFCIVPTSLKNQVTPYTLNTSSYCTLISTLDCSNGVNVPSVRSNLF